MRVLGVDPGLTRCGVGVVDGSPGRRLSLVRVEVLRTSPDSDLAARLLALEAGIEAALDATQPRRTLDDTQRRRTLAQQLFARGEAQTASAEERFGLAEAAAAGRRDLDLVGRVGVEFDRRGQRF